MLFINFKDPVWDDENVWTPSVFQILKRLQKNNLFSEEHSQAMKDLLAELKKNGDEKRLSERRRLTAHLLFNFLNPTFSDDQPHHFLQTLYQVTSWSGNQYKIAYNAVQVLFTEAKVQALLDLLSEHPQLLNQLNQLNQSDDASTYEVVFDHTDIVKVRAQHSHDHAALLDLYQAVGMLPPDGKNNNEADPDLEASLKNQTSSNESALHQSAQSVEQSPTIDNLVKELQAVWTNEHQLQKLVSRACH